MRILGIDPGYERLGIAIIEKEHGAKERVVYSACFKTPATIPHPQRLLMVGNEIERVIDEYKPQALAIETLFFSKNQKTALHVSEARGTILFASAHKGLDIYEYSPAEIKIAVSGYGKSDKVQMIKMVRLLVEVRNDIKHDDEYDAIAAGLTCFAMMRLNGLTKA
jgi:crossover junction endodeoxyribonuclease RuvC